MSVEAVLLDIDDTLVDTRGAFRVAIAAVNARWLPHLDDDGRRDALAVWTTDAGGHFRAYTRGELDFHEQRRRRLADLHGAFGGPVMDEAAYREWVGEYEAAFSAAWRLTPDAGALVEWIAAAGLRTGFVTNAETAYQQSKLDAVGLGTRIPILAGTDTFGAGKPDPRMWWHACERLGVEASRTVYVGDEVDVDARGARDAGLLGIWLDRHATGAEPDDVPWVRSLDEVPAVIARATDGTDLGAGAADR